MKSMNMKIRFLAVLMVLALLMTGAAFGESAPSADTQRLDASYTLALNAINAEDYETAREYLNICFAYCDSQSNPVMFADLLLKRACIDVIEGKNEMALLNLDAALRVQPDLADAYLVKTQVYAAQNDPDAAIVNLEKYIELTEDTSMYETVAQLQEARGDLGAAQEAYEKFAAGAGKDVKETGFQNGLYQMQAGKLEDAIASFEAYAEDETYGAGAMFNIGICKLNLGDYAGAIEAFDASEKKGGSFEGMYYNRGICYLLTAEWTKGAADFAASLEKEPYQADAQYNLGICQMQLGDYEAAAKAFTKVIDDAAAAAKAAEGAEETAAPAPVNDGAYYYRAVCNAALGKLEEAAADFTVCIEHGYDLAESYYQRAQVYGAMGDTEKQNSDLENSLKNAK